MLLRATTAVSNGWLASRLGIGEPARVSQFVRRFRMAQNDQTPVFKGALSELTTPNQLTRNCCRKTDGEPGMSNQGRFTVGRGLEYESLK